MRGISSASYLQMKTHYRKDQRQNFRKKKIAQLSSSPHSWSCHQQEASQPRDTGDGQREKNPKLHDLIQTATKRGAPVAGSELCCELYQEISGSSSPSYGAASLSVQLRGSRGGWRATLAVPPLCMLAYPQAIWCLQEAS